MEICMQQHAPLICINRETTQSSRERPNTMISREDKTMMRMGKRPNLNAEPGMTRPSSTK